MSTLNQLALNAPNIANDIAKSLSDLHRPLMEWICNRAEVDDIWITRSRVWSHLYTNLTPVTPFTDLDILCTNKCDPSIFHLCPDLQYNGTCGKYALSPGLKFNLDSTPITVDAWNRPKPIFSVLLDYPESSHAHCRVAFNFVNGLVVLPNTQGWQ